MGGVVGWGRRVVHLLVVAGFAPLAAQGAEERPEGADEEGDGADGGGGGTAGREGCLLGDRGTCVDAVPGDRVEVDVVEVDGLDVFLGDADVVVVSVVAVVAVVAVAAVELVVVVVCLDDLVDDGGPIHLIDNVHGVVGSALTAVSELGNGCRQRSHVDWADGEEAKKGRSEEENSNTYVFTR